MNKYPEVIKNLIDRFRRLPGIGEKTSMRLAFFLLNSNEDYVLSLAQAIIDLKKKIKLCKICFNFSENDICEICSNPKREKNLICVVETVNDMYNIEQTGEFKGLYHILHGVFSPVNGMTFENLKVKELLKRIKCEDIKEVIIATNPTSEGNTTAVYLKSEIEKINKNIKITRIASGIPVGAELEYIDKLTLSEALKNRINYL